MLFSLVFMSGHTFNSTCQTSRQKLTRCLRSVKEFVEKTIVYNLEVEKYHTYIAEGIRVHNLTNKWAGKGSGFDPRMGGRAVPGLILIDSSEWEKGGGRIWARVS